MSYRLLSVLFIFLSVAAFAKDQPQQVVNWPDATNTIIRITFNHFKEVGGIGNQHTYMSDTVAENLWDRKITAITFTVHVYDKNKTRIGDGFVSLDDVGAKQSVKFATNFSLSGRPEYVELVPAHLPKELGSLEPPKMIGMTINSVPQGADLKVDGNEVGTTPKMIKVGVGKHTLTFSKDGFNNGNFPLEIGPDDVSGGSVSFELGTSAYDTVELRDGTVLNGDLVSVSGMDISVRIGGTVQNLNRNQVKRIIFVERDAPASPSLPAAKQ